MYGNVRKLGLSIKCWTYMWCRADSCHQQPDWSKPVMSDHNDSSKWCPRREEDRAWTQLYFNVLYTMKWCRYIHVTWNDGARGCTGELQTCAEDRQPQGTIAAAVVFLKTGKPPPHSFLLPPNNPLFYTADVNYRLFSTAISKSNEKSHLPLMNTHLIIWWLTGCEFRSS